MGRIAGVADSDDSDSTSGVHQKEEQRLGDPIKIQTGQVHRLMGNFSGSMPTCFVPEDQDNLTSQLARVFEASQLLQNFQAQPQLGQKQNESVRAEMQSLSENIASLSEQLGRFELRMRSQIDQV